MHAHGFIGQLVHKGGVGTVLQQAAHQVGQEVFVRAHGGVHAAGHHGVFEHFAVHALAHAVQALQLKLAAALGGHLQNGGDGGGVVRGELRVDGVRRGQ